MTSVSWLFYGRRTRLGRSIFDSDDLGSLSSDRSHDTNPSHRHRSNSRKVGSSSACGRSGHRRLHPRSDQHHRQNHHVTPPGEFDESGRLSGLPRQPCSEAATSLGSVPIQQLEGVTQSPFQSIAHGDTLDTIRGRFTSNERLPRSVLLARERLLQRLRGMSVSSDRESHEAHQGTYFDSYWLSEPGNSQTSNSGENLAETLFITNSNSPAPMQLHEAVSDPHELEREALASLHHELYAKVVEVDPNQKFSVSHECSICLERFTERNELVGLKCGHRFHPSCLGPWVQTCRKCPYCRSEI